MTLFRESFDREPPEPQLDNDLPTDEEFYGREELPKWTPDEESDDEETQV